MAIGEFGGAATLSDEGGSLLATPMYWFYELGHAALNPSRALADATRLFFRNPANPLAHTSYGKSVAATMELFERSNSPISPSGMGHRFNDRRCRKNSGACRDRVATAVLPASAF